MKRKFLRTIENHTNVEPYNIKGYYDSTLFQVSIKVGYVIVTTLILDYYYKNTISRKNVINY